VGDLSAHFSRAEFAEHGSGALPGGMPARRLVDVLEAIRAASGGRALTIVSGYRSPAYNRSVGGAPDSQHIYGRAADLPPGYCTAEVAQRAGAVGIGVCDGWVVHVDVRPTRPVIFKDCPKRK